MEFRWLSKFRNFCLYNSNSNWVQKPNLLPARLSFTIQKLVFGSPLYLTFVLSGSDQFSGFYSKVSILNSFGFRICIFGIYCHFILIWMCNKKDSKFDVLNYQSIQFCTLHPTTVFPNFYTWQRKLGSLLLD